jgi:hypothetical protein
MTDGPSLLQTMAAAVDLHKQHHRLTARPPAQVPDAIAVTRKAAPSERATLAMVNNAGGRAPPLVLMKRVEPKEEQMSSQFETLLKAAVNAIERGGDGDLDTAERLLAKADKMVDASTHHHYHYSGNGNNSNDDDDDEDDGWDDENGNGYTKAKSNNFKSPSDPSNDEPDDEDEDDNNHVKKASYHHDILGGNEPLPAQPTGTRHGPDQDADPYALGTPMPATRTASTHKFDRLIEHVQDRDGCSKNEAMATARREYPDVYTAYQDFVASSPTNEQHSRRAGRGVAKSMTESYEDLVSSEMRKGLSWRTAEQRVINQYGSTAFNPGNRMIKRAGPSVTAEFTKRADQILWDTPNIDRCEALRRLRKRSPHLYDALNNS